MIVAALGFFSVIIARVLQKWKVIKEITPLAIMIIVHLFEYPLAALGPSVDQHVNPIERSLIVGAMGMISYLIAKRFLL